jgi:hypothetical protein
VDQLQARAARTLEHVLLETAWLRVEGKPRGMLVLTLRTQYEATSRRDSTCDTGEAWIAPTVCVHYRPVSWDASSLSLLDYMCSRLPHKTTNDITGVSCGWPRL